MTNIQFIFNVADKQGLIFEIIASSVKKNRSSLTLFDDKALMVSLSDMLWHNDVFSFLPHQTNQSSSINKICLSDNGIKYMDDILINATNEKIEGFSRYLKLYELIGLDELEKANARKRFTFYKDCGYKLSATDHSQVIL
ncbi:DNA polymerase III subunit chi [Methylophilaceae bacterium]|uniref:DNA polymerase III chi subunit, HolC n=1 Tax=Methylophilales bacterium HTCC2181 TaxID=383631 RepID=A0P4J9_9PROT|nr:DNA polymerase III chi subunit, HolC [Methylophilales bacterium HTCC2181]MCH9782053.1 DNA polymerase III subunit chi [Betaproteobacteria bacterium]MDC0115309.1 DNA polymerase III subunit chi [Methylophilaceae bacterium]MDC0128609.1 DNA polymerase III subunit chi [Methylophilaceae bacterium]MDC1281734.1 DNA polymerase III subunit chi [Methylophilaceae bacterium]